MKTKRKTKTKPRAKKPKPKEFWLYKTGFGWFVTQIKPDKEDRPYMIHVKEVMK